MQVQPAFEGAVKLTRRFSDHVQAKLVQEFEDQGEDPDTFDPSQRLRGDHKLLSMAETDCSNTNETVLRPFSQHRDTVMLTQAINSFVQIQALGSV